MIVINTDPTKKIDTRVCWAASNIFTVNENGLYKMEKCRFADHLAAVESDDRRVRFKGEFTQAEMMSYIEKILVSSPMAMLEN